MPYSSLQTTPGMCTISPIGVVSNPFSVVYASQVHVMPMRHQFYSYAPSHASIPGDQQFPQNALNKVISVLASCESSVLVDTNSHDSRPPRPPKSRRMVMLALKTIAASEPPTTVARNNTFIICIRFLLRQRSTKPSVSFVRGNFLPSGMGTSRNSHKGFQPSPILYSSSCSLGTSERISS